MRGRAALHGIGALALLLLAGCASAPPRGEQRYAQTQDGAPAGVPPDVAAIPLPVPRPEPLSRYGNRSSYQVNGRTYHVLPSAAGYDARGIASWYGTKFQGYLTSSLEPYDMYKFTAASKVLPIPSYARVTNLENGRCVIVRVNDRGPFVADRIIDLSYVAAIRLGIQQAGTGLVRVQGIDANDPANVRALRCGGEGAAASDASAGRGHPLIYLQVGAFLEQANAERVLARLRDGGLDNATISATDVRGQRFWRVRLGPLPDAAAADALAPRVQALGLPPPQVSIDMRMP